MGETNCRPLNDAYLVLEAPQSRVALDTALRRTIGHRPYTVRTGYEVSQGRDNPPLHLCNVGGR
eukprot:3448868-Prymnesium_polylepis.1